MSKNLSKDRRVIARGWRSEHADHRQAPGTHPRRHWQAGAEIVRIGAAIAEAGKGAANVVPIPKGRRQ
jgi:hypothetical protein